MSFFSDVERDLVVADLQPLADDVLGIELVAHNGRDLPEWTPGAHVDLLFPAGPDGPAMERQYSLCGARGDRSRWRVAVLREADGRGGSRRVHEHLEIGQRLRVRGPRDNFGYTPDAAAPQRFIAGGIGITPMLAMIEAADAAGAEWTLDYAGRSLRTMAFAEDLRQQHPERVRLYPADAGTRFDVAAAAADAAGAHVYACGPMRLLDEIDARFGAAGAHVHVERFEAIEYGEPVWQEPFEVELAMSGDVVVVQPEQTVLEAIEAQAPHAAVISSCRRGTCGTCEVPVIEGEIEHRDSILTPSEREASMVMMACVSRAACPRIVLDV